MSEHETEIILNRTHFRRIISESRSDDTAKQLAEAFSTQATQIGSDINALLTSETTTEQAARGLLHRLRGSAEIIGACRLSHITCELLDSDRESFYPALRSAFPLLQETIEETLTEIQALAK